MRKIALIGPSGVGKSTAAAALAELGRGRVIKLSAPLHALAAEFYRAWGLPPPAGQDRDLMERLAEIARRMRPGVLAARFLAEVRALEAAATLASPRRRRLGLAVCDDLRDPDHDAPALRAAGFAFVRIEAAEPDRLARLGARGDASGPAHAACDARLGDIPVDLVLRNDSPTAGAWGARAAAELLRFLGGPC